MYKKTIGIINYENQPIYAVEIKEFTSKEDYEAFKKMTTNNFNALIQKEKQEKKQLEDDIINYKKEVNAKVVELAKAIKVLTEQKEK